jgi:hypothetical protein
MHKKIHIISLIVAVILWAGGLGANAAVYDSYQYLSPDPGMPFWPQGNSFGSGKFQFFPELAVGLVYNDNIYLDENDEESDVISHVIPRLMIDYSLEERGHIKLGYAGDFAVYTDFSDNNWQRHNLGFEFDYNAPSGLFVDLGNNYVHTSDPFGSAEEYALGQQKKRWYNLLGLGLGYNHADATKVVGYANYNVQEYKDTEADWSQNFDEISYGAGFEKRVAQKTWSFVRYFHGERDYSTASPDGTVNESNDADFIFDRVAAGLTWDLTSRVTGELNFGYGWLDYENPADADGVPYEDQNTWLAATGIDYAIKPGVTNMYLRLERGVYPRGSFTSELFTGTDLSVGLTHRFYSWYKFKAYVGVTLNEYNTTRDDEDFRAGLVLEYLIHRRWTLGIGYDYYRRNSNEPGESWTSNRGMITITWRY